MDLRALEVFCKIVELRSFSRAAEAVLLTQPTVSGHIKTNFIGTLSPAKIQLLNQALAMSLDISN